MKKVRFILALLFVLSSIGSTSLLEITVDTDKDIYQVGEDVHIYVLAYNPNSGPVTLTFLTSIESSYVIDDIYNWAYYQISNPSSHSIILGPYASKMWDFIHGTSEQNIYPLTVGNHSVVGQVGAIELSNINSAPIQFEVIPEPATLALFCLGFLLIRHQK